MNTNRPAQVARPHGVLPSLVPALLGLLLLVDSSPAQDFGGVGGSMPEASAGDGSPSLIDVLREDATAGALRLTNAQRKEVEQILAEYDRRQQALQKSIDEQLEGISSIGEKLRKRAELMGEKRTRTEEHLQSVRRRLQEVLSEAQRRALQQRAARLGVEESVLGAGNGGDRAASESGPAAAADQSGRSTATPTGDGGGTASFGGTESGGSADAGKAGPSEAPAGASQRHLSFNFHGAPWPEVLKLFADAAGLTLNLRDVPSGEFTYYDDREYTPSQALDIMNRFLMQDGYLLVRHDRFLTVFSTETGVPPNLVETVPPETIGQRGETELLRVIFPLNEGRDAEKTSSELQPLLGPLGQIAPLPSSNSVVVTDIGANLLRIKEVIGPPPKLEDEQLTFQSFALEHISAYDAAEAIRNLFPVEIAVQSMSSNLANRAARPSRRGRRFGRWRRDDDDDDERRMPNQMLSGAQKKPVAVAVDPRTNSLLVRARHADMRIIEEAIKSLDVEGNGESLAVRPPARDPNEPYLEVYELQSADVDDVEQTLRSMYPDAVFNEDDDTNRIHAYATAEQHRQLAVQIRQIDGAFGRDSLAVIPTGGMNPYDAGGLVSSLFARDGQNAPSVQVGPGGRNLIVRGSSSQIAQIRTLLEQYGSGSDGLAAGSGQSGPVRRFSVNNPERLARMLQRLWPISNPNPIRIVPPEGGDEPLLQRRGARPEPSGQQRQLPAPTDDEPSPGRIDASLGGGPQPMAEGPAVFSINQVSIRQRDSGGADAPGPGGAAGPESPAGAEDANAGNPEQAGEEQAGEEQAGEGQSEAAPITVSVEDGELVIASEDEEALDRLQGLIDRLSRSTSGRTQWKVFYLRAAEAAQTATMLAQLIPAATVETATAGLTGGYAAAGGTLSPPAYSAPGPANQTLRIIPESRLNALFVTGPPELVRDVQRFLKVLDSNELPESLRDRVPRMIPVEHAGVTEVAEIVRDVYRDYLPAGGGNGRNGDRRRGANGTPGSNETARLTLGVDTQTGRLIVSANESLFRDIEELVAELDRAAYEAEQVIRVVPSDNGPMMAQTLDSLFPQVTISTTGASRRQPGADSSEEDRRQQEGARSRGDDNEWIERMRRFREMRERMRRRGGDDRDRDRRGGRGRFRRDR